MSFDDDELSQGAGEPIELYEFVGTVASWRYASGASQVDHDGHAFVPLAGLIRSTLAQSSNKDTPTLAVTLPSSAGVVVAHSFGTPPRNLVLRVIRIQTRSTEFRTSWEGEVTAITPKGPIAEVLCPSSLAARLDANVPGVSIQKHCQHFLFDERCGVLATDFDLATVVSSVADRSVTVAGVGGNPDQWFRAGEIVRDSDGERRTIVDQVGGVLKIHAPFRTLANGNAVTLFAGCDHDIATCHGKFANRINFSGFTELPDGNPFKVALQLRGQ